MTPTRKITYLSLLAKDSSVPDDLYRLSSLFILYEELALVKFTQAELAHALGVSLSSVKRTILKGERRFLIFRRRYGQGKYNSYSFNYAKLNEMYKAYLKGRFY